MEHDMSDDDSHSFGLYSSRKSKTTLESCFRQSPRWDSNSSASAEVEQKTFVANSIPISSSSNPQCLNEETCIDRESTAISLGISTLLSLSEPRDPWETPSKQPLRLTHCSYPRVFCNPVSDCENRKLDHTQKDSSTDPDSSFTPSTRNHQGSPVNEASPNPSNSTISNDDILLDVERTSETEVGNQRSEPGSMSQQRCGVCKKLLSQKSPWCSYKMLRCGDMPAAGVFPCHHVYHVECLDKVAPTAQTREPACPVCSNTMGAMEQPLIMPETLQQALISLRRSHTALGSEPLRSSCNDNQTRQTRRRSHKWGKISCCLNISFPPSS